jgi:hypothetical protein
MRLITLPLWLLYTFDSSKCLSDNNISVTVGNAYHSLLILLMWINDTTVAVTSKGFNAIAGFSLGGNNITVTVTV